MPSRDSSALSDQLGIPDIFHSGYDEFLEDRLGGRKQAARRRSPRREITTEKKEREKAERSEK
jgi:hypothetical protein